MSGTDQLRGWCFPRCVMRRPVPCALFVGVALFSWPDGVVVASRVFLVAPRVVAYVDVSACVTLAACVAVVVLAYLIAVSVTFFKSELHFSAACLLLVPGFAFRALSPTVLAPAPVRRYLVGGPSPRARRCAFVKSWLLFVVSPCSALKRYADWPRRCRTASVKVG